MTRLAVPRLRTVTGNPFPRKCVCDCGGQFRRDPQQRYVVDFGGPKPFKTYLRQHSPDCGTSRVREFPSPHRTVKLPKWVVGIRRR
jgi:hypothetical protein